jgi:hypothetical protein
MDMLRRREDREGKRKKWNHIIIIIELNRCDKFRLLIIVRVSKLIRLSLYVKLDIFWKVV